MSVRPADAKEQELDLRLAGLGSVLVAFSGGVDSSYLAVRAYHVLGPRALAVTADSESLAAEQRERAAALAREQGFAHRLLRTHEIENPLYARNDVQRCYHCKVELFRQLRPLARELGLAAVAYGLILDDLEDFRPGQVAAREAEVLAPLADAGMTKDDVRVLSRRLGLATAELPASPCLASRLPYGTPVTAGALRQVDRAEAALRGLGFRELRVRHLGTTARVEIGLEELPSALQPDRQRAIEAAVRGTGYEDVRIDPQGYRRGRLNEALRVVAVSSGV